MRSRRLRFDRSVQRRFHRDLPSRVLNLAPFRDRRTMHFRLRCRIRLGRKRLPRFVPDPALRHPLLTPVFLFANRFGTERFVGDAYRNPFLRHRTGKRHVVGVVLIRLRGRKYDRERCGRSRFLSNEPHVERKPHGAGLYPGYPLGDLRMNRSYQRLGNYGGNLPTGLGRSFRRVASRGIVDSLSRRLLIFL